MKKRKELYLAIIFSLAIVIGIGYAALTSNLNIVGNTTIKGNTWDIHFENFQTTEGSVAPEQIEEGDGNSTGINPSNTTEVNYIVRLQKPGDFYEFTVDAVNKGTIDAMVDTVSNTGLTVDQQKYLSYTVQYADNYYNDATKTISQYHKLPGMSGNTYYYTPIKVRVEFKKDLANSDLPSESQPISLTFSVDYVQADTNAITGNAVPSGTLAAAPETPAAPEIPAAPAAPANLYLTRFDGTYGYDGPGAVTYSHTRNEGDPEWVSTLNLEWLAYLRYDQTKIETCGVFSGGTVCLEPNQWSGNVQCYSNNVPCSDDECGVLEEACFGECDAAGSGEACYNACVTNCTAEGYVAAKKAEFESKGVACLLSFDGLGCGNDTNGCSINYDGSVDCSGDGHCSSDNDSCYVYSDGGADGHSAP